MTSPEPYPDPDHSLAEPVPPGLTGALVRKEAAGRRWDRARRVRIACTLIKVVCGLFAAVLAAQIILVIGEANPANGVATFVRGWSSGVSLGFDGLFTPASAGARALLNNGLAAIVWLGFGAVVTTLIRRLTLPGPDRGIDG